MRSAPEWTDEIEEQMKLLVGDGLSASAIARIINQRFGTKFTRSAVLGKIHRKKWEMTSPGSRAADGHMRQKRVAGPRVARAAAPHPPRETVDVPDGRALKPDPDHPYRQSATGLPIPPSHLCHWIFGDVLAGTAVYCARNIAPAAAALGRPYCAGHWRVMHDQTGRRGPYKPRPGMHLKELNGDFR